MCENTESVHKDRIGIEEDMAVGTAVKSNDYY